VGIFVLWLAILSAADRPAPRADLETIVAEMQRQHERQQAALCAYSCTRVYTLKNPHLSQNAVMTFQVTTSRAKGKQFQLVSQQHVGFLVRHALMDIVDGEPKTEQEQKQSDIDPNNYKFRLLGEQLLDGKLCYVLELSPRRSSKFLVEGKAWVDAQSYAIRRVQGRLAESVSFWVGRPEVEENFAEMDGFWMPSHNSSLSHVKLVGPTTVDIQFSGYRFERCPSGESNDSPK
jgi:hypothetical protein